jgi:hypothetical protein
MQTSCLRTPPKKDKGSKAGYLDSPAHSMPLPLRLRPFVRHALLTGTEEDVSNYHIRHFDRSPLRRVSLQFPLEARPFISSSH